MCVFHCSPDLGVSLLFFILNVREIPKAHRINRLSGLIWWSDLKFQRGVGWGGVLKDTCGGGQSDLKAVDWKKKLSLWPAWRSCATCRQEQPAPSTVYRLTGNSTRYSNSWTEKSIIHVGAHRLVHTERLHNVYVKNIFRAEICFPLLNSIFKSFLTLFY